MITMPYSGDYINSYLLIAASWLLCARPIALVRASIDLGNGMRARA